MKEILIVEDNSEIKILLETTLDEYSLSMCSTLKDATQEIKKRKFDLLLLDLGLPDGDGLRFLTQTLSEPETKELPVIILSAKSEISNKVMAFSLGAEDFISKPFDPLELRARVASKIKKSERLLEKSENLRVGDLHINIPKQKIWVNKNSSNESIDLTTLEFKLLLTLARAPDRIFSREYLLNDVWGHEISVTDRTVDTHIGHLRKKIANSKTKIDTVIGSGYRFIVNPTV